MEWKYPWINYNHDYITIRSDILICERAYNLIFRTSQKKKNICFFRVSFVNLQCVKDGSDVFDAKYRYEFLA